MEKLPPDPVSAPETSQHLLAFNLVPRGTLGHEQAKGLFGRISRRVNEIALKPVISDQEALFVNHVLHGSAQAILHLASPHDLTTTPFIPIGIRTSTTGRVGAMSESIAELRGDNEAYNPLNLKHDLAFMAADETLNLTPEADTGKRLAYARATENSVLLLAEMVGTAKDVAGLPLDDYLAPILARMHAECADLEQPANQ